LAAFNFVLLLMTKLSMCRFAAYLYKPSGLEVTQRVWEETLDALNFAQVRAIIESMKSQEGGLEHLW
jgi:hypothetical protein